MAYIILQLYVDLILEVDLRTGLLLVALCVMLPTRFISSTAADSTLPTVKDMASSVYLANFDNTIYCTFTESTINPSSYQ